VTIAGRTGLSLLIAGLWSTTAHAQVLPLPANETESEADAEPEVTGNATVGVGDIVVTANRRSENLQKVPIAISAFDGDTLAQLGIQSTTDLPQVTPGLVQNRSIVGVNAFLRGVGQNTGGYTSEVPVSTYLDGLYLPNSAAAAFVFNNIERIEVLKGPQGTLYGRNTTGGLIHVITKDPGSRPALDVSASYGNYDTTQLNFYGSTPITDTIAVNIAAVYINQEDGWGRNAFTGSEAYTYKDFGIQGKIQWTPTPDTEITLRAFYDHTKSDQGVDGQIYQGSVGADGSRNLGEYVINTRMDPFAKQTQRMISLKVEQGLGFATLTNVTGYIKNTSPAFFVQTYNVGNTAAGQSAINFGLDEKAKTFSNEIQLTSENDGPVSWIVGAFYYRDKTNIKGSVFGTCVGNNCAGSVVPRFTNGTQKTRSLSGYADGTYSITPTTRLTLGIRYTSDRKIVEGLVTPLPGLPNSVAVLPASQVTFPGQPFPGFPNGIDPRRTFNKLTYRIVAAQDLAEDVNVYASYNRGFKSGGHSVLSYNNPPTEPEVLDAWEIGIKSRTADRVLQVNAAAFYYIYKDIQLRTTAPPAPVGSTLLYNAAKAHIKGIDVDVIVAPVRGLSFTVGAELLDAKYADFPGGICSAARPIAGAVLGGYSTTPCVLDGFRLPQAPKFSYALGVQYLFDTSIGEFEFTASDGYKSHFFWEPNNRLRQDGFHIINAALTWSPPESGFSLQAFGRNLTGSYYYTGGGDGAGGNDFGIPGAPRTYGIKARYKF
jgi:iron complex outermembrane recepter protein